MHPLLFSYHLLSEFIVAQKQQVKYSTLAGKLASSAPFEKTQETLLTSRVKYFFKSLDLSFEHLEELATRWQETLQTKKVLSKRELISIAKSQANEPDIVYENQIEKWRLYITRLLKRSFPNQNQRIDLSTIPFTIEKNTIDFVPILYDFPNRIIHDPQWTNIEAPLPDLPSLSLEDVWVDVNLVSPEAIISKEKTLTALKDYRYLQYMQSGESAYNILERLTSSAVLVGAPGIGKTTLMKWLVRQMILQEESSFRFPIYIPLRLYALEKKRDSKIDLLKFGLNQMGIAKGGQLSKWYRAISTKVINETVLVLLDGWDEVPLDLREDVREDINVLRYLANYIITSRPTAHPKGLPAKDYYEITELSEESIHTLIYKWFESLNQLSLSYDLINHLNQFPDLMKMVRNPFLLHLVCGIVSKEKKVSLKDFHNRTSLYKKTVELIRAHHTKRYPSHPFSKEHQKMTEQLALWLMKDAKGAPQYLFDSSDVLAATNDSNLLPDILKPSRLINQFFSDQYDESLHFTHATFQEFLAAKALLNETDYQIEALLDQYIFSNAWQEVFKFISGGNPNVTSIFWKKIKQLTLTPDRFGVIWLKLASLLIESRVADGGHQLLGIDIRSELWKCICKGYNVNLFAQTYITLDRYHFLEQFQKDQPSLNKDVNYQLTRLLASLPSPETRHKLLEDILSIDFHKAAVASYSIRSMLDAASIQQLTIAFNNKNTAVKTKEYIINALGKTRQQVIVDFLITIAKEDKILTKYAIRVLGEIGGESVIKQLINLFEENTDETYRVDLIKAISFNKTTLSRNFLLKKLATTEPDSKLTTYLLEAFCEVPNAPWVADMLLPYTESWNSEAIRIHAIWALKEAQGSRVRPTLIELCKSEVSEQVRIAALCALRERFVDADIPWLIEIIQSPASSMLEKTNALEGLLLVVRNHLKAGTQLTQKTSIIKEKLKQVIDCTITAINSKQDELVFTAVSRCHVLEDAIAPTLLNILKNEDYSLSVKETACKSLGMIRNSMAVDPLLAKLKIAIDLPANSMAKKNESQTIALAAAKALTKIQPDSLLLETGSTVQKALADFALDNGYFIYDEYVLNSEGQIVIDIRPPKKAVSKTIFISYSHDTETHTRTVQHFADKLQQEGFTVIIDTVVYPNPKEGWQLWMQNGINAADYVLLICTANYHRRFHKQELKPNIGRGVTWEGAIIYQIFYDNHCQNTKFVPVIAEEDSKQYIPQIFKNWTGYRMYSGFENLVNHLRK